MSVYDQIAWLPLCGGLTGLGLVLSYMAWRKRGWRSALRGTAWSLLPLAAYLTGAIEMFWKIGVAVGDFGKSFAFSPKVWSGIAVAGLAAALFMVTGGIRRRRRKTPLGRKTVLARKDGKPTTTSPAVGALSAGTTGVATVPATKPEPVSVGRKAKRASSTPADDDMKEVEDILRKRGIN